MRRNASRYLFAFRQRQCQPRSTPGSRPNPTKRGNLMINQRRRLAKSPPNRFERLTTLPAIPQLRLLGSRETSTKSLIHRHTPYCPFKIKCCVHRLRPPPKEDIHFKVRRYLGFAPGTVFRRAETESQKLRYYGADATRTDGLEAQDSHVEEYSA